MGGIVQKAGVPAGKPSAKQWISGIEHPMMYLKVSNNSNKILTSSYTLILTERQ